MNKIKLSLFTDFKMNSIDVKLRGRKVPNLLEKKEKTKFEGPKIDLNEA